jgi:hypothetical protein
VLLNIWFQMHYMTGAIRHVTLVQRALGAGAIVWFYLLQALIPVRLMFILQWDIRPADVRWWAPLTAAAVVTALLLQYHRRRCFAGCCVHGCISAWRSFP